jgi:WD40 repeat protein
MLQGHGDSVCSICWSADGTQLLTACEDMLVRTWELLDVTARWALGFLGVFWVG